MLEEYRKGDDRDEHRLRSLRKQLEKEYAVIRGELREARAEFFAMLTLDQRKQLAKTKKLDRQPGPYSARRVYRGR